MVHLLFDGRRDNAPPLVREDNKVTCIPLSSFSRFVHRKRVIVGHGGGSRAMAHGNGRCNAPSVVKNPKHCTRLLLLRPDLAIERFATLVVSALAVRELARPLALHVQHLGLAFLGLDQLLDLFAGQNFRKLRPP